MADHIAATLSHLNAAAHTLHGPAAPLARALMRRFHSIAARARVPLPDRTRRTYCTYCGELLAGPASVNVKIVRGESTRGGAEGPSSPPPSPARPHRHSHGVHAAAFNPYVPSSRKVRRLVLNDEKNAARSAAQRARTNDPNVITENPPVHYPLIPDTPNYVQYKCRVCDTHTVMAGSAGNTRDRTRADKVPPSLGRQVPPTQLTGLPKIAAVSQVAQKMLHAKSSTSGKLLVTKPPQDEKKVASSTHSSSKSQQVLTTASNAPSSLTSPEPPLSSSVFASKKKKNKKSDLRTMLSKKKEAEAKKTKSLSLSDFLTGL